MKSRGTYRQRFVLWVAASCLVGCLWFLHKTRQTLRQHLPDVLGTVNEGTAVNRTKSPQAAAIQISLDSPSRPPPTFACVGSRQSAVPQGNYFAHFPHSFAWISQCWSHFLTISNSTKADNWKCVLAVDLFIAKRLFKPDILHLNSISLLESLPCEIREFPDDTNFTKVLRETENKTSLHIHFPNMTYGSPFLQTNWVQHPSHAADLRERFLQRFNQTLPASPANQSIKIGILDRPDSRHMNNVMDVFDAISRHYPQHLVELTTFSHHSPVIDHVVWFATHSIIVVAHGAAVAHSLWLKPGSTVLELFPTDYYPVDMFGALIEQVGSRRIPYYINASSLAKADAEGKAAHLRNSRTGRQRFFARLGNLTVPIPIVLELLDRVVAPLDMSEWKRQRLNELHERTRAKLSK